MSWKTIVPLLVIVVLVAAFFAFRGGNKKVATDLGDGTAGSEPESEVLGDTLSRLVGIVAEEDTEIAADADEASADLNYESDLAELEGATAI